MDKKPDIFISYTQKDESIVRELTKELSLEGFKPWIKTEFPSGNVQRTAPHPIEADLFLVCLSNNAVDSKGRLEASMQRDLSQLWQRIHSSTFLIPIRLEDCQVPESLKAFEPIDLFAEDGRARLLEAIAEVTRRRRELEEAFAPISAEPELSRLAEESLEGPLDPNSTFDWGVDLRRLITGERENTLQRLGGVEEYVEVMLAEAEDDASAGQAFNDAFEQLVQTWQPSTLDSDFHITHMLDLVSAYTPRGGFVKVISLVQGLKRFGKSDGGDAYSIDDDVYLKAFVAMENYYKAAPKAPEDQSPAYQTYVDLLREDLSNPVYVGYALKRLVELRVMELGSEEVEALIETNPGSLAALLGLIIDPSRKSKTQEELRLIYSLCLQAGSEAERHFENAVIQCGGQIERIEEGPRIDFRGVTFVIALMELSRYRYWEMLFERENAKGLKRVEAMMAIA